MSQLESSTAPPRAAAGFSLGYRLFSLAGILPLGAFFVAHLANYAGVLTHRQTLEQSVPSRWHPLWGLLPELVFVALPLLYHAAYGLLLWKAGTPSPAAGERSWRVLQRVSGLMALAFVLYHVWSIRLPLALGTLQQAELFTKLCQELSTTSAQGVPVQAICYLLGLAASAAHLARGLLTFCVSWRICRSPRQARVLGVVFSLLGLSLFVLGADTILYFATGSAFVFDFDRTSGLLGGNQ